MEAYARIGGALPHLLVSRVYGSKTATRLIRRGLTAVLPGEMVTAEVRAGPLQGARLPIYPWHEVSFLSGLWEFWLAEAIESNLEPGDVAWDVGAYIGYFTLLMARTAGAANVAAFEPEAEARRRLETTLTLNQAEAVEVLPVAIGGEAGRADLRTEEGHPAAGVARVGGEGEIEVRTLDVMLETHRPPRLVKLDIEGAEADAVRGSPRMVNEVRPVWVIEVHGKPGWEACRLLEAAGYRVVVLNRREMATHQPHVLARCEENVTGMERLP